MGESREDHKVLFSSWRLITASVKVKAPVNEAAQSFAAWQWLCWAAPDRWALLFLHLCSVLLSEQLFGLSLH